MCKWHVLANDKIYVIYVKHNFSKSNKQKKKKKERKIAMDCQSP